MENRISYLSVDKATTGQSKWIKYSNLVPIGINLHEQYIEKKIEMN